MQTIQDRGYVWKKGQALVPTWTAFAVVNLLEQHFGDLVDYAFTAAHGRRPRRASPAARRTRSRGCTSSTSATATPGLQPAGRRRTSTTSTPRRSTRSRSAWTTNGDERRRASRALRAVREARRGHRVVPDDLAPDELTVSTGDGAARRAEGRRADRRDSTGLPVYAKNGRFGAYVQWGDAGALPPAWTSPRVWFGLVR